MNESEFMSDWIGLGVIVTILGSGIYALGRVSLPRAPLTDEEYEKRLQENKGRSMLSAGVMGLQKILEPAVEKAVEVQEDFRQGYYDGEQESGDANDTNPVKKLNSLTGSGEH